MTSISNHARERIKQRAGSKDAEKVFGEALLYGTKYNETKGNLKRFLTAKAIKYSSDCIIYKGSIFWHHKTNLITVTPLPQRYFKYIKATLPKQEVEK